MQQHHNNGAPMPATMTSALAIALMAFLAAAAVARAAAAAAAAAATSSTYTLQYDARMSPTLLSTHHDEHRQQASSSEEGSVPAALAEDISTTIASHILQIHVGRTKDADARYADVPDDLRSIERRCYENENDGSRTCTVDHYHHHAPVASSDEEDGEGTARDGGAKLRMSCHFYPERTVGGSIESVALQLDATLTTITAAVKELAEAKEEWAVETVTAGEVSRNVLVDSIPKINASIQSYRPVWSVRERPSVSEAEALWSGSGSGTESSEGSIRSSSSSSSSVEEIVLSDPKIPERMRIASSPYTDGYSVKLKPTPDDIEIWQYRTSPSTSNPPARSLFLDGTIRATTNVATTAHAESFAHPALVAQTEPARVAVLSAMPIATVREVLKHELVEHVTVVGADSATLDLANKFLPQMNDCSGWESGRMLCMEDEMVEIVMEPIEDWLEDTIEELDEEEIDPFDVIFVDVDSSGDYLLSLDFHRDLKHLLQTDSVLVINSGSEPSMDRDYGAAGAEYGARDEFLRQVTRGPSHGGLGYAYAFVYEEPLASPLDTSFIIAFPGDMEADLISYREYIRKIPASIDLDIVSCLYPSTKVPPDPLTLVYDGPTHLRHLTPTRAWESWYCNTRPGKDLNVCRTFLRNWFDRTYHHDRTEIRNDPVKGRAAYAVDDIPEGHFVLAEDTVWSLMIDADQWMALNDFVRKFPEASMYTALKDFFIAYGYESEVVGKSGWSVSLACNNTFVNHACTAEERKTSSLKSASLDEDGDWLGFSPVVTRRADIFGILAVAVKDIKKGEEIMSDYSEFREDPDAEFIKFLNQVCDTGEGLVTVHVDDEKSPQSDLKDKGEL